MRAVGLILLACGCAEWPRFRYLPGSEDVRADPASDPRDVLWDQVRWKDDLGEDEDNSVHWQRTLLEVNQGWVRRGALAGWGWDETASSPWTPDDACGDAPDFPPQDQGYYTGDIDWFGVLPAADATLCAEVRLDLDGDQDDRRFDMMLYRLDACDVPVEPAVAEDDAGGEPAALGYPMGGAEGSWGSWVTADASWGVVLAGWAPQDDPEGEPAVVDWTLAVSLVGTGTSDEAGLCPRMPEDL